MRKFLVTPANLRFKNRSRFSPRAFLQENEIRLICHFGVSADDIARSKVVLGAFQYRTAADIVRNRISEGESWRTGWHSRAIAKGKPPRNPSVVQRKSGRIGIAARGRTIRFGNSTPNRKPIGSQIIPLNTVSGKTRLFIFTDPLNRHRGDAVSTCYFF